MLWVCYVSSKLIYLYLTLLSSVSRVPTFNYLFLYSVYTYLLDVKEVPGRSSLYMKLLLFYILILDYFINLSNKFVHIS